MRKYIFLFMACMASPALRAQLLPSIGLASLPADTDSVCAIPVYTGGYANSGYDAGDTVPDFTLFDVNGSPYTLSALLAGGKPVLLVAGSYTCPVFRNKIPAINNVVMTYAGLLGVFVVYTVEAHPIVDPSPYSGTVWVPSANYSDGVLFEQPRTYGERKALVDSLQAHLPLSVPVLIDGPCNPWWEHFGPAPNNATLIRPDGVAAARQPWFDKAPDNIYCAIDSLLGTGSGLCTAYGNNGTFGFKLIGDSTATGAPGQTLAVEAMLKNQSAAQNAVIDIVIRQSSMPAGWTTALCADVCYAPGVDSIRLTLAPSDSQSFIFYFYTGAVPASGMARVVFRNAYVPSNRKGQGFYGDTNGALGLSDASTLSSVAVYPVPVFGLLRVRFPDPVDGIVTWRLVHAGGRCAAKGTGRCRDGLSIDAGGLAAGMYVLEIFRENAVMRKTVVVMH